MSRFFFRRYNFVFLLALLLLLLLCLHNSIVTANDDNDDREEDEDDKVSRVVVNDVMDDMVKEVLAENAHDDHDNVMDQEQDDADDDNDDDEEEVKPKKKKKEKKKLDEKEQEERKKQKEEGLKKSNFKNDDFDVTNEDWGTYYDPQNIFCGQYDCYKILGFDYESYQTLKPTTKDITQRYRRLSREWHPDKSKHKNAKEKFVKIARAYEVLTNYDTRKEYDLMRYDFEAYVAKYGSSVIWQYAPKSDTTIVIILVLIIANIISWYAQKHRWQLVADRLIKAAVEDWLPRDGGTEESKHLREEALHILYNSEKEGGEGEGDTSTSPEQNTNGTTTTQQQQRSGKKKGKGGSASGSGEKGAKISSKEKKKQEQEALLPIIKALVNEIDDFGSGFHKPTWRDLAIVSLSKLPYKIMTGILWQSKYYIRRLQKLELNDEEKDVLTSRAVGPVIWNTSSIDDRNAMIQKELWITENLVEWNEEQEIKKLSASEQKYYNKLKKKGIKVE